VEGFLKGLHFSARRGSSTEFIEHRAYAPGDEIRRIDWRTFGRTDRYFLKEYEDETNLRATLVLDASGSMGYASAGITKLRYATLLAGALGYLLLAQRDAVGLAIVGASLRRYIPPKATPRHLAGIFSALESVAPEGETRLAECIHGVAGLARRRSFIIIISDFLDEPASVLESIAHLRRGSEALLLHVMDPAEEEFPFTGWTVFRDAERPGAKARLDARQMRDIYLENLAEHLSALRTGATALGADHAVVSTRRPFDDALAAYLDARARRREGKP